MEKQLDIKGVRAILHAWGGMARSGAGPKDILHGCPTRNPIDRMRQQVNAGRMGDDPVDFTPTEAAVARLDYRDGPSHLAMAISAHSIIIGLPLIPRTCIASHYRDREDAEATGEILGCDRSNVYRYRQRAEEAILAALKKQEIGGEALQQKAA